MQVRDASGFVTAPNGGDAPVADIDAGLLTVMDSWEDAAPDRRLGASRCGWPRLCAGAQIWQFGHRSAAGCPGSAGSAEWPRQNAAKEAVILAGWTEAPW